MQLLIKHGRVIDPVNNIDKVCDILVEDNRIAKVAEGIKDGAAEVIDAKGMIVLPGLVDMHAHLRQPGREDKETIESATLAALKGGVTSLLAMPNTDPAIDSPENVKLLKGLIEKNARAAVLICGSITKGRKGAELTDIAGLKKSGAIAISDDGASVDDPELFLAALKLAGQQGVKVIAHCEDKALTRQGVINLGFVSTRLGLRGISRGSEYKRVERDIQLAAKAKAAIHIAHVSCRESVEIIAAAKKKGVSVTAETAPHYFTFTDEAVSGYDTNMKMNPPLRGREDVEAIRRGLKDGTIEAIASDHAPHTENEKDIEFDRAEFGVVGLETELSAAVTELVAAGILDWAGLVRKLALNPARILGIDKGSLSVGKDADIVIISPDKEWTVSKDNLVSKSKNSAFLGRRLKAVVEYTLLGGKVVYNNHSGK